MFNRKASTVNELFSSFAEGLENIVGVQSQKCFELDEQITKLREQQTQATHEKVKAEALLDRLKTVI